MDYHYSPDYPSLFCEDDYLDTEITGRVIIRMIIEIMLTGRALFKFFWLRICTSGFGVWLLRWCWQEDDDYVASIIIDVIIYVIREWYGECDDYDDDKDDGDGGDDNGYGDNDDGDDNISGDGEYGDLDW